MKVTRWVGEGKQWQSELIHCADCGIHMKKANILEYEDGMKLALSNRCLIETLHKDPNLENYKEQWLRGKQEKLDSYNDMLNVIITDDYLNIKEYLEDRGYSIHDRRNITDLKNWLIKHIKMITEEVDNRKRGVL